MKKLTLVILLILLVGFGIIITASEFSNKSISEFMLAGKILFFEVIGAPYIIDSNFKVEIFVEGLDFPTTMAFLGDDILVLQKNDGKVRLIRDGKLLEEAILDLNVHDSFESGLLGITTVNSTVYLFLTEPDIDGDGGKPTANNIYKYEWDGNSLLNPILVNSFPGAGRPIDLSAHQAGVMVTTSNGTVYAMMGDQAQNGIFQNNPTGELIDAGIIVQVGIEEGVTKPSLSKNPFDHYYAMGIRNGFGLDVDPVSGYLWDTENGRNDFDEVNLVMPKFNSGWNKIMGPATGNVISNPPVYRDFVYSDPEFSWEEIHVPTALSFPAESPSFEKYRDTILIGDCNRGKLLMFKLNSDRTGFVFQDDSLKDLVFNPGDKVDELIFGSNFGCVTDIEFSELDMYIVAHTKGIVYKVYYSPFIFTPF